MAHPARHCHSQSLSLLSVPIAIVSILGFCPDLERAQLDAVPPGDVPPNQYAAGMDYDPVNKVIVMFGGYSSTVVRSATWLLTLVP